MQFNFRPAKGWRAFAGEVGVEANLLYELPE